MFVESAVSRCVGPIELARATRGDETVRRIQRPAGTGSLHDPSIVPVSDPEPCIAELSPGQTLDAIYEGAAAIRLELIYSPSIGGDLRKRWANRLGDISLLAPTAAAEIQGLRNELAQHESDWHDSLHLEIAQIRHGLWRLRQLCLRHQELSRQRASGE
jgi:hypothetical protein